MLHVGDVHDHESEFGPPEHAEADHQAFRPGEPPGVARGEPRGRNLNDEDRKRQCDDLWDQRRDDFPVEDDVCAQVDEEDRSDPGKRDVIDDGLGLAIVIFVRCAEVKVLFLEHQPGHVRADRRVKAQGVRRQPDQDRQGQHDEGVVLSPDQAEYVLDSEPPQHGQTAHEAVALVRKHPGAKHDHACEKRDSFAEYPRYLDHACRSLARDDRYQDCHQGQRPDVVEDGRRHDARGGRRLVKSFALQ